MCYTEQNDLESCDEIRLGLCVDVLISVDLE